MKEERPKWFSFLETGDQLAFDRVFKGQDPFSIPYCARTTCLGWGYISIEFVLFELPYAPPRRWIDRGYDHVSFELDFYSRKGCNEVVIEDKPIFGNQTDDQAPEYDIEFKRTEFEEILIRVESKCGRRKVRIVSRRICMRNLNAWALREM